MKSRITLAESEQKGEADAPCYRCTIRQRTGNYAHHWYTAVRNGRWKEKVCILKKTIVLWYCYAFAMLEFSINSWWTSEILKNVKLGKYLISTVKTHTALNRVWIFLCSFFGKAFEQAASATTSRILQDSFDFSSMYFHTIYHTNIFVKKHCLEKKHSHILIYYYNGTRWIGKTIIFAFVECVS